MYTPDTIQAPSSLAILAVLAERIERHYATATTMVAGGFIESARGEVILAEELECVFYDLGLGDWLLDIPRQIPLF